MFESAGPIAKLGMAAHAGNSNNGGKGQMGLRACWLASLAVTVSLGFSGDFVLKQ